METMRILPKNLENEGERKINIEPTTQCQSTTIYTGQFSCWCTPVYVPQDHWVECPKNMRGICQSYEGKQKEIPNSPL